MAYKVAFVSKNNMFQPADDFASFLETQGVDFQVEKFDVKEIASNKALSMYDAVLISSFADVDAAFVDKLASSLSLYAKCVFKTVDSGNLTHSNLIIVTDVQRERHSGFATNKEFGREVFETQRYSELEIERTARIAYEFAEKRDARLTLTDSPTGSHIVSLWRKIVSDINEDYPAVRLEFESSFDTTRRIAENMQSYDVILTERDNFFALSGVADAKNTLGVGTSQLAYLGETTVGLYATERAAVGARIFDALSFAKMLECSFDLPAVAEEWKNQIGKLLLQN